MNIFSLIPLLSYRMQGWIEQVIYKHGYRYRQTLLTFSEKMNHVLDANELAESIVTSITKSIKAEGGTVYLPDSESGDFLPSFTVAGEKEQCREVRLANDNPVVIWLAKHESPLGLKQIDVVPQLRSLWQREKQQLIDSGIELFFPIKSKGALVGILALGKKRSRSHYLAEDLDVVMTMTRGAGVALENAQLYAAAKTRANIDELTGLFNHRYFHQRVDEEISRCSRFGHIFSLALLDLDLFKVYNDVNGHLAGDGVLRQIGQHIKAATRGTDISCRYGGDEFAIIFPQTSLTDAYNAVEAIRTQIEFQTESRGLLTTSAGIASWPTDGVMREELVGAADNALYHAKRLGRNRTFLASELASPQVQEPEAKLGRKEALLSTIYALAATVDAKDRHTYGHSRKVATYAAELAKALGYSMPEIETIRTASLLHDIGKIGIAEHILAKPGPLTPKEWELMHAHPDLGVAILKHVEDLKDCLAAVRYHHERYDGSGYPAGLKGENIPLDARILAVADAYDAMTSERPFRRRAMTYEQAREELRRCAGTQFDPKIVEVFISNYHVFTAVGGLKLDI